MLPAVDASPLPRAAAPLLTVERIEDDWGFTALRPHWNELLRSSAADNPFLTWEWLHTWWKHARGTSALRIIAVRAGGELIALAPLRITAGPIGCFSRLEFLGTGGAGSDYLDIIVRTGHETEGVGAIARCLRKGEGSPAPTLLRFDHVLPQSHVALVAAQLAEHGWISSTAPGGVCPTIRLAGHTWDSYLGTLGSAHRANVRRRLRGLEREFDVRFERVTGEAQRREALTALVAFHQTRWTDRGGTSAFPTAPLQAFHDDFTRRALERDWLRLYILRLNGAPAAVMYGFFSNRRFYFYQHGFDEQYKAHSVGLAVMAMTIRAAIDEGADEFDMLWGTEAYKSLWADDRRLLHQIQLYPARMGGRVHWRAVAARRRLGRLARRVFPGREASAT